MNKYLKGSQITYKEARSMNSMQKLCDEIDELRSLLERAEDGLTTIMKPNWGKTFEVIEELNQLLIDIRAKLGVK